MKHLLLIKPLFCVYLIFLGLLLILDDYDNILNLYQIIIPATLILTGLLAFIYFLNIRTKREQLMEFLLISLYIIITFILIINKL